MTAPENFVFFFFNILSFRHPDWRPHRCSFRCTSSTTCPRTTVTRSTRWARRRRLANPNTCNSSSSSTSKGSRLDRTGPSTPGSWPVGRTWRTCWWCDRRPWDNRRRGGTCTSRRWPGTTSSIRGSSSYRHRRWCRWSRPGRCRWSCTSGNGRTTNGFIRRPYTRDDADESSAARGVSSETIRIGNVLCTTSPDGFPSNAF